MKSWDDEGLQLNHLLPAASHLCKQQCCSSIEKYSHFEYFSIYIKFNHLTKRALGGTVWQRASFLGCGTIPASSPGGMQPPSPPSVDAHQCVPVHLCVCQCLFSPLWLAGVTCCWRSIVPKATVSSAPPAPSQRPQRWQRPPRSPPAVCPLVTLPLPLQEILIWHRSGLVFHSVPGIAVCPK